MNAEQFWASIKKEPSGCWVWTRAIGSNGYGGVSYGGVTHQAHRLAWILARGPIPIGTGHHGTIVGHKCDNRACCNPDHLFLTDASGNMIDRLSKGRSGSIMSEETAKKIVAAIVEGGSKKEIADRFGVSHGAVASIASKRSFKHLTRGITDLRFAPREANPEKRRTADYQRIRSLLDSGKTLREIARLCGTTHPTVARVARQARQEVATPFRRFNAVDRERICDLAKSGASVTEIGRWLDIPHSTVSRTLTAAGVT